MKSNSHKSESHAQGAKKHNLINGSAIEALYEKNVVCIEAEANVVEASKLMSDNHIGDVVVADSVDGTPLGIITDRDIVVKVLAREKSPESTSVGEVMSKTILTAHDTDSVSNVVDMMTENGVSRLPVVNSEGKLCGILSSKHLFQLFAREMYDLTSISEKQQEREMRRH